MGASSSTEQVPAEQREIENLAASTGAFPMLQDAFSKLADPDTKAVPLKTLQQCFSITFENTSNEAPMMPGCSPLLLDHMGQAIVDLFFIAKKGEVSWTEFLRGYVKCCGRAAASTLLNNLFRLFSVVILRAGLPEKIHFDSDDVDCKMSGSLIPHDVLMLLLMCWIMSSDCRNLKSSSGKAYYGILDISHLVLSAAVFCAEVSSELNLWDCDISALKAQLPAGKIHIWALKTVPCLADCITRFVHARLQRALTVEEKQEQSCLSNFDISTMACNTDLLTHGRAWAVSLTLRGTISEEVLKASFPRTSDGISESLLYRSCLHGKGLNRFWSNVEGYNGPVLILIAASSGDAFDGEANGRRWIIGALTEQGFENKDMFYGSFGSLYAISPVFNVFSSSGREKNFVYSRLHPTGRVYDPHPKPVGIAFGGSIGNERIFIDEDFARVTIRHHAVDKTYQPGSLFPDQGFLPTEALVLEVEVWGLGGKTVKEMQSSFKKREELFTEQRRKIDLKTFASWEDSPEKMMMDMVSDPNTVQREDR